MRLYGSIEGHEIIFDFVPPKKFIARLPTISRGSSVITLYAMDDAGNISADVRALVLIDFAKMSVRMLNPNQWAVQDNSNSYISKPANGGESLWYSMRAKFEKWDSKFLII